MRTEIPQWMAGEYEVVRAGRATAAVRRDFLDSFRRHRLIDCPHPPALVLPEAASSGGASGSGLAGGRGPVRLVSAGALGEAVVRPFRRGGWVETVNRRRYFLGDRAFAELVATNRLRKRGARVPEPLAAVRFSARPGYLACLVTRHLPKTTTAAAALGAASEARRSAVLECAGRAIRLLHQAGGDHADLNAHNLLVPEEGEGPGFVIDLDRVSVAAGALPARRARANLARLRRSLRKLGLEDALAEWRLLERAYEAPPDPPPAA